MYILMIVAFVLGYFMIAMEHPIKVDKAASAILTGVICWVILVLGAETILGDNPHVLEQAGDIHHFIQTDLLEKVGEIAEILFFLLAAMTIVELIDAHEGFNVVTKKIETTNRIKLLWIIAILTFLFSAILDNLTTSIVMAALLKKLVKKKEDLWFFAGMVVLAANAGGAWSPIGDVTTIMLWIGGQITSLNIITSIILPSLACLLVPLLIVSMKKNQTAIERPLRREIVHDETVSAFEMNLIFWLGVSGLLFVPIFKSVTHLPPFMGMLFSLGILWVVTEIIHRKKNLEFKSRVSVASVIRRIDTPSILFFLGILLAVASLQTAGHLTALASAMDNYFGNIYVVNILVGLLSSIVDNVPLVAGAIGMYDLSIYPPDHAFWELLAYCAGTGGSVLIIGSAAGVAIMGILKIDFIWYLKNISWLALIGYFSGVVVYYLMNGG